MCDRLANLSSTDQGENEAGAGPDWTVEPQDFTDTSPILTYPQELTVERLRAAIVSAHQPLDYDYDWVLQDQALEAILAHLAEKS